MKCHDQDIFTWLEPKLEPVNNHSLLITESRKEKLKRKRDRQQKQLLNHH